MPVEQHSPERPESGACTPMTVDQLTSLGPEAQGDVDESLLRDNLALTPLERLMAASEAASQVEVLRRAMKAAGHA